MEKMEISFGAKDSELKGWEYTIPEGFEAEIKDGKIIVKQAESNDERIRKELIALVTEIKLQPLTRLGNWDEMLAYLEKHKGDSCKSYVEGQNYVLDYPWRFGLCKLSGCAFTYDDVLGCFELASLGRSYDKLSA